MDSESRSTDLGSWADADFARTVNDDAGIGADAGFPDHVRFISGIVKLIRRYLALSKLDQLSPKPAIFLLEPSVPTDKMTVTPTRVPMLDNGLTTVTGRLWFVNAVVVTGKYIEIDAHDDDQIFREVTETLQLGHVPAILFDPRLTISQIRFYSNGLGQPESYEPLTLTNPDVTLSSIFKVIDRIYESCLVTPEAQTRSGKLWAKEQNYWAAADAEDVVQTNLKAGLATAFPTCTVRHEQTSPSGRLDLEIEESDPVERGRITRHAVLELKVLRSYGSSGAPYSESTTLGWVRSGVEQAAAYRDERSALASALCCFDMRKEASGETCFDHVRELATELKVEMKIWYIYATSHEYRSAITAAP